MAALCGLSAGIAHANDLEGIGYADFSTDTAQTNFAAPSQQGEDGAVVIFIDSDDGSVRITPMPQNGVVSDTVAGYIGFVVPGGYDSIAVGMMGVDVDVDGDGRFVNLKSCLTSEGVRLTIATLNGTQLWSETRTLPYDTEATCQE